MRFKFDHVTLHCISPAQSASGRGHFCYTKAVTLQLEHWRVGPPGSEAASSVALVIVPIIFRLCSSCGLNSELYDFTHGILAM